MTPKETALAAIKNLPENATFDDIEYHLYVVRKIENAMRDVETGNVISHEEMKREVKSWFAK